jgi:hypothetical protein
MSYRGLVFKAPGARALSGIKAYECLPRSEAGPKNGSGTWHVMEHALGGDDTWTEHDGQRWTQCLAWAGSGCWLCIVLRVPKSYGTDSGPRSVYTARFTFHF